MYLSDKVLVEEVKIKKERLSLCIRKNESFFAGTVYHPYHSDIRGGNTTNFCTGIYGNARRIWYFYRMAERNRILEYCRFGYIDYGIQALQLDLSKVNFACSYPRRNRYRQQSFCTLSEDASNGKFSRCCGKLPFGSCLDYRMENRRKKAGYQVKNTGFILG